MQPRFLLVAILMSALVIEESDAWWFRRWRRPKTTRYRCPSRSGATPYYFGTTNLFCIATKKGKRESAPSRNTWAISHRFIYYKGKYFDFLVDSKVAISTTRFGGDKCSGGIESNPAGYSSIDVSCIEGCARNYRCRYGNYWLLGNNCHKFANRISAILCTTSSQCPSWCLGSCTDAFYSKG